MTYVDVVVRVNTEDKSFAHDPVAARAMVQNMLRHDPRFARHRMEVVLMSRDVEDWASRRTGFTNEDVTAWNATKGAGEETAGENLHNLFEDHGNGNNSRREYDGPRPPAA